VTDTKLKRRPHPKHVLQLALYSDLLAEVQGVAPEHAHVELGDGSRATIRLADVSAYARRVRARLEAFVADTCADAAHPLRPYASQQTVAAGCTRRGMPESPGSTAIHLRTPDLELCSPVRFSAIGSSARSPELWNSSSSSQDRFLSAGAVSLKLAVIRSVKSCLFSRSSLDMIRAKGGASTE
jgi:hypothetical protein